MKYLGFFYKDLAPETKKKKQLRCGSSKEQFISHVPRKNTLIYLTTAQFACVFVSPDSAWMPTIWITYHAPVEEELMENLSLWHLHIHKARQPAA